MHISKLGKFIIFLSLLSFNRDISFDFMKFKGHSPAMSKRRYHEGFYEVSIPLDKSYDRCVWIVTVFAS